MDNMPSNASLESQGTFLESLSTTITNFNTENYGSTASSSSSSSSSCTTCNGNGVCQYNPLYLKDTCQCDPGWIGDTCSVSQSDSLVLQNLTQRILNEISAVPLRLTMNATWSEPYLNALLELTNPSLCAITDLQRSLDIVSKIITNDYNVKTTVDVFDPVKMTVTAKIINSCMSCIYKTDCFMQSVSSKQLYNTSIEALTKLATLQLWQKLPNSGNYTIDTDDFQLYSLRVTPDKLNGITIAPPNAPIIVLQQASQSSGTTPVDIQLVFWKKNLMSCPQTQKEENTPPVVSMTLNEQDKTTPSSLSSQLSAQISYPLSSSGQRYSNCSAGCTSAIVEGSGGTKYFQCTCKDLSSLSSKSQAQGIFAKSDLYKLLLADALVNFDYLGSWAFWMLWGLHAWLILTLFLIKAMIVRPLKFSAYASQTAIKSLRQSLQDIEWFKSIFYGIKVSPLFLFRLIIINLVRSHRLVALFLRGQRVA